jgi:predicted DNA-binding protein YlxM (UPF0122 family)
MSLVTQAFVFERYGPRLSTNDLAELLKLSRGTIHNQLHAGTFPIATYKDGGQVWADYRHVAEHIDACHERAKERAA